MDLREAAGIVLLSRTSGVDMKTVQKNDLFTFPEGKIGIVTMVVTRMPSASLAGGTDYDFGAGVNADSWRTAISLAGITAVDEWIANMPAGSPAVFVAGDVFGIKPITGSTLAATATIDLFGYLFDA